MNTIYRMLQVLFPSPMEEAAVLIMDGVGEWATTSIWSGKQNSLEKWEMKFPHSIGLFYSTFTSFLGFKVNSGEYKVMGLAPYGNPIFVDALEHLFININDNLNLQLNMNYFDFPYSGTMFSKELVRLLELEPRPAESPLLQKHMDLAASLQVLTEKLM